MAADARKWAMGKLLKLIIVVTFVLARPCSLLLRAAIDNCSLLLSGRSHGSGSVLFQLDSVKSVSLWQFHDSPLSAALSRSRRRQKLVTPRSRPAPNLPTATLQTSKETYLLSHNPSVLGTD